MRAAHVATALAFSLMACGGTTSSPPSMHEQPAPGATCEDVGATMPAGDDCNECTCTDAGSWACTDMACPEPPADCTLGSEKLAEDGCNLCECTAVGWACTDMACDDEPECTGDACEGAPEDEPEPECTPGDTMPASDDCNTCQCSDEGSWSCTLVDCEPAPECPAAAELPDGAGCGAVVAYGRTESGLCCMYPSPCQVPEGLTIFYSMAECEGGCGSWLGDTCADTEYCAWEEGQMCGALDEPGVCTPRPGACTKEYAPVCGCDGVTYGNACEARAAGVDVFAADACPE